MVTQTKHSDTCSRVFKNYDMQCPRCIELASGSTPRDGWQKSYYERKAQQERWLYKSRSAVCCSSFNLNPGGYCNACGSGRDFS